MTAVLPLVAADAAVAATVRPIADQGAAGAASAGVTAVGAAAAVVPDPAAARRQALSVQRASQRRVERQYGAAAQGLREAVRGADDHPAQAHRAVAALAQAMVDQLQADGEPCIRLLGSGVPVPDRETGHGLNVAVLSLLLGRQVGVDAETLAELGVGALLHDVGLQALPARLRHTDPQRAAEVDGWRGHVEHGVSLGRRMALGPAALAVLAEHHEQADGSGFPRGASGEQIALAARLVALVDHYDELCNPAPGAAPLTPHEALSLLYTQGRTRHDPTLLAAFIHLMGVYPAGSAVQLNDDRYALVVSVNPARPLKPRVLVHDAKTPPDEALLLDLGATDELSIRRSLTPAKLPPAALKYLAPQARVAWFFETLAAPSPGGAA
jgi:HD-GYP domain-containing protein (c-di-GMP phosphodiesterase class II)